MEWQAFRLTGQDALVRVSAIVSNARIYLPRHLPEHACEWNSIEYLCGAAIA